MFQTSVRTQEMFYFLNVTLCVGSSIGDIIPAIFLTTAINAALYDREKNGGNGVFIDIAMVDSVVAVLENQIATHLLTGKIPGGSKTVVGDCAAGH